MAATSQDYSRCVLCNMTFSGIEPYTQHIASKRHLKRASQAPSSLTDGIRVLQLDDTDSRSAPGVPVSTGNSASSTQHVIVGSMATAFGNPHGVEYFCKDCNCGFSGPEPAEQHFKGKQHQKTLRRKELEEKLLSTANMPQTASQDISSLAATIVGSRAHISSLNSTPISHKDSNASESTSTFPESINLSTTVLVPGMSFSDFVASSNRERSAGTTSLVVDTNNLVSGAGDSSLSAVNDQKLDLNNRATDAPSTDERDIDIQPSGINPNILVVTIRSAKGLGCKPCGILLFLNDQFALKHFESDLHQKALSAGKFPQRMTKQKKTPCVDLFKAAAAITTTSKRTIESVLNTLLRAIPPDVVADGQAWMVVNVAHREWLTTFC